EQLVVDLDRVVARLALVGTTGDFVARDQKVHAHILGWDVVAGRQPRLEKETRTPRFGYHFAADDDLHRAEGVEHVDPLIGVAWMHENLLILFVPGVHAIPIERDKIL